MENVTVAVGSHVAVLWSAVACFLSQARVVGALFVTVSQEVAFKTTTDPMDGEISAILFNLTLVVAPHHPGFQVSIFRWDGELNIVVVRECTHRLVPASLAWSHWVGS